MKNVIARSSILGDSVSASPRAATSLLKQLVRPGMLILLACLCLSARAQTAEFTATGSMGTARTGHTAMLLQNGKVLIAGGMPDLEITSLSSAELYDPVTGTFSPTGSMTAARAWHTATLLPSGKVLITGGTEFPSDIRLSSAELYDPATGTFSPTGSMGTARVYHTATLLQNGKVLIATGDPAPYVNTNSAELYDPATGIFTPTGNLTTGRTSADAVLLPSGQVLIVGGGSWSEGILSSAELYDPATGAFTLTGSMNTSRVNHTATLLANGNVLIVGGEACCYPILSSAELYNPVTGTFSTTGNLGTAREVHTATQLPSGEVLIAGGWNGSNLLASAELYDPITGNFTAAGNMATAIYGQTATLLQNGAVLIAGGSTPSSSPNATSSAELYGATTATANPTFTPIAGTYTSMQTVSIADTTPGATIYYTLDGSTPTTASAVYSTALTVSQTMTIKAIAAAAGYSNSAVASAAYIINLPPAATPAFTPGAGTYTSIQKVKITDSTTSATIYYTLDGSMPTTASAIYTGKISVNQTTTISAIAVAAGYSNSAVASATYTLNLPPAAAPTFNPAAGTYTSIQTVTLADSTTGASIYYTLDGSTPTTASTKYTRAITVNQNTTINAIAVATGYSSSSVASASYIITLPAAAPTFTPEAGAYGQAQWVTLASATPNPTIYYTTDGSTPSESSAQYTGPIAVSVTTTIKAIASATGYIESPVASARFTLVSSPRVLTGLASDIVTPAATLNATVHDFDSAGQVWFLWGTSSTALNSSTEKATLPALSGAQIVSAPLTGLAGGTTYYFQPVASTVGGTSYGAIQSFTTN